MAQKPNPYNHEIGQKGAWGAAQILETHQQSGQVYISLAQFRADILPHLANPNNKDVSYWLDYVKHPNAPLHVLDETGKELYVVPPLSASISTGMAKIGTHALNGQMEIMRKRIERSPRSRDNEFAKTLSPHIRHTENVYSNRVRLNQILVAEGYPALPLPGIPNQTGVAVTPAPSADTKTTVGYLDEFEDSNL